MAKKNILFILAHMDDEVYSSGTIMKLIEDGHKVHLLTLCGEGRTIEKHKNSARIQAWKKISEELGLTKCTSSSYYDLSLKYMDEASERSFKIIIEQEIRNYDIDWVFTNHEFDQHSDHKAVSELVRLCCREDRSTVKKLYECYIPGSTERGIDGIKHFNIVIEISKYISKKKELLKLYGTELLNANDIDGTILGNSYFGKMYGFKYAEIFKLVYSKGI